MSISFNENSNKIRHRHKGLKLPRTWYKVE